MIFRISFWRSFEFVPVIQSFVEFLEFPVVEDFHELLRVIVNLLPHLCQVGWIRHIETASDKTFPRLYVDVITGLLLHLATAGKPRTHVHFIGTLVLAEADIAINAKG